MKTNIQFLVILVLVFGLVSVSANRAQAALVDRGGGLIYDTDLNITWLADANYAMTSGYDADGNGSMVRNQAMTWASNLAYGGYTDWRLPTADPVCGFDYNCIGSEMGHLFYTELGGVAGQDIATTHNTNYNLFLNVQSYSYWSGTAHAPSPDDAWTFNFNDGGQGSHYSSNVIYAWAVRPGDVAPVPIPAAFWLFGSGLIGLIGVARQRKMKND